MSNPSLLGAPTRRRRALVLLSLMCAALFAAMAVEAWEQEQFAGDVTVRALVQAGRVPVLERPMRVLSALGGRYGLVPLCVLVFLILKIRRQPQALLVPVLTGGSVLIEGLAKWLVHRPRPEGVGFGFPSGHVIASVVFVGALLSIVWTLDLPRRWPAIASAAGVVVVTGIAFSRLYLDAHWLTDVLGGVMAAGAYLGVALASWGPRPGRAECERVEMPVGSPEISAGGWASMSKSGRILAVRLRRAKAALWIAVAALALVVTDLGQRVLATNDEARFAVLAQTILDGGDWLLPQIAGAVYHNKPLLQAWLIALVSWPVGQVTQFTAVLPSALAAIACALAVYELGRELFGRDAGRLAAFIMITTEGVFLHARLPLPDMLMTFLITASMWMFARMLRQPERPTWVAFYGLVGAAFWSKGPAGLLPLAVAIAHAVMHIGDGGWRRLRLFEGLALVTTLVAPWWLAGADWAAVRHTVVVDQLFWYWPGWPTMDSLTGPLLNSAEILLPWTLVAPWALVSALRFLRGTGAERNKISFLLEWAGVTLLAVGLSHQQRLRYYLPLVPPIALLLGWWCAGMVVMHRRAGPVPRGAYGALASIWVVAVVTILARKGHLPPGIWPLPWSPWETLLLSAPLGLMVGGLVLATRCRPRAGAFLTACLGSAVLLMAGYHWTVHRNNALNDYTRLDSATRARAGGASIVATWDLPALPVSFYLARPVIRVDTAFALLRVLAEHPDAVALVPDAHLGGLHARASLTPLASGRVAGHQVTLLHLAQPPGAREQAR